MAPCVVDLKLLLPVQRVIDATELRRYDIVGTADGQLSAGNSIHGAHAVPASADRGVDGPLGQGLLFVQGGLQTRTIRNRGLDSDFKSSISWEARVGSCYESWRVSVAEVKLRESRPRAGAPDLCLQIGLVCLGV